MDKKKLTLKVGIPALIVLVILGIFILGLWFIKNNTNDTSSNNSLTVQQTTGNYKCPCGGK